jgi:hypothetical protein
MTFGRPIGPLIYRRHRARPNSAGVGAIMDGSFDEDVDYDAVRVGEVEPGPRPPAFGPLRRIAELASGDDLLRVGDGGAVRRHDVARRLLGRHPPVAVLPLGPEGSPATTTPNRYRSSDSPASWPSTCFR